MDSSTDTSIGSPPAATSSNHSGLAGSTEDGFAVGDVSSNPKLVRTRSVLASIDGGADGLVHNLRHPSAVRVVERAAHLGDGGAIWLLLLTVFGGRNPKAALRAAGFLAIGSILVNGPLKKVSSRPRPLPLVDGSFRPKGSSFPSGHSFSSWLMVLLLPPVRGLRLLAVPLASFIAFSRVFLRYHHPSDVVAGSLLGASVGLWLRRIVRWR